MLKAVRYDVENWRRIHAMTDERVMLARTVREPSEFLCRGKTRMQSYRLIEMPDRAVDCSACRAAMFAADLTI